MTAHGSLDPVIKKIINLNLTISFLCAVEEKTGAEPTPVTATEATPTTTDTAPSAGDTAVTGGDAAVTATAETPMDIDSKVETAEATPMDTSTVRK
jgi:hypothetical protein